VVDLDAMQRNLTRMADFARSTTSAGARTPRCTRARRIARLQMQAGAVGVCVQKTAEAEAMVAGGVTDVYISNEVVAPHKLARVAALAQYSWPPMRGQLAIAVDSAGGRHAGWPRP
jgi:D-serine deaminase-like pyridoxal phosphate-dependent protein